MSPRCPRYPTREIPETGKPDEQTLPRIQARDF
jgi:hypothetical protein